MQTTDKEGNPVDVGKLCLKQDGFAQVYPADKYNIVKWIQMEGLKVKVKSKSVGSSGFGCPHPPPNGRQCRRNDWGWCK